MKRRGDIDVVVVGGGLAGVTAARDCAKNGHATLLLEARDRLGGRAWTSQFEDEPIEFGGTWVYNCQPFIWTEIERYGLEIEETPGAVPDQMILLANDARTVLSGEQLGEAVAGWMQYTADVRGIVPRPYDLMHNTNAALAADSMSALDHLNSLSLSPLAHAFCEGIVELVASGTADSVSYLDILRFYMLGGSEFSNFMDSAARFKLKLGTIGLVERIASDVDFDIRMNAAVSAIEDRGDHVRVKTNDGQTFRASAVVSTLPMNVIADVQFKPELPDAVRSAAQERHPGKGGKFFLKVDGQIGNVATVAPGRPLNYTMTFTQSARSTLLVAFSSDMDLVDHYDHETLQTELGVHLPGARLLSSTFHDWNADPHAKGTWATYRPGWARTVLPAAQQQSGRIHFASGDHGEGWRGTMDGAIGAGVRAAQAVRNQLG